MKPFVVVPAGQDPLEVDADNWLVALGLALERLGTVDQLGRLACEALPNGTVIAKDLQGAGRYVIHEHHEDEDTDEGLRTLDPEADLELVDSFGSWLHDIDESASAVFAAQAALAAAQVAVPCDSASVLQLDSRGLRFVAASGPIATQLVGRYIPSDAGAAGFAVQHRQVMVLYEVGDDPRHYEELDSETGYQTRNLCCVPVMRDEDVFGVIEVVNFPTGEPFQAESIAKLERVARHLARRLAEGPHAPRLAAASAPEETDEEAFGDPETLDTAALEPISVGDIALALPPDEAGYVYESDDGEAGRR